MNENEYNAAEAVEIGKAEEIILGDKSDIPTADFPGGVPADRLYKSE